MKTSVLGRVDPVPQVTPGNRTFRMRLDPSAIEHIIEGLSTLYIDPLFATAREEIANAIDANSRVPDARPVEVSFPGGFGLDGKTVVGRAGEFVVRDFGPGMDADELEAYGSYGFSDKRESNTERGGFGLGSKSPLSFVDTFRIVSVKAGLLYEVVVHRDVSRVGLFEFTREGEATSEPNGVTVRIPITAEQSKRLVKGYALRDSLIAYPYGSILVQGSPVANAIDNGGFLAVHGLDAVAGWVKINTVAPPLTSKHMTRLVATNVKIVLGGVLYDMPSETVKNSNGYEYQSFDWLDEVKPLLERLGVTNQRIYLNLPVGSLRLPRSRDRVIMDDQNKATIITGLRLLFQLLPQAATSHLNTVEDPKRAAVFYANNWGMWEPGNSEDVAYEYPTAETAKAVWRGHELGGKITMPGSWHLYTSYIGNGFSDGGEIEAGLWPFYAALCNRLSLIAPPVNGLRVPRGDDLRLEADFILQVPDINEDTVWKLNRNVRAYGRHMLQTANIGVLVTSEKNLGFWAQHLLPVVTWDDFLAWSKTLQRTKNSIAAAPAVIGKPLMYPLLDLTAGKLFEIASANIRSDAVYMRQEMFASNNLTNTLWQHVEGRKWDLGMDNLFTQAVTQLVGERQVVPLPKDRSLDSFVKRYAPEATDLTDLVAARLCEVAAGDMFDRQVFVALGELVRAQPYAHGRDLGVIALAKQLYAHQQTTGERLTNQLLAAVMAQIGEPGDLYLLLNAAQALRPGVMTKNPDLPPDFRALLTPRTHNTPPTAIEELFAVFAQGNNLGRTHLGRVIIALNAIMP